MAEVTLRLQRLAFVLCLAMALNIILYVAPAKADTQTCVVVSGTPSDQWTSIRAKGYAFCIGWGHTTRYAMVTYIQKRYGREGAYRWVTVFGSLQQGEKRATARIARVPGRYRSKTELRIVAANGWVIKRYGWDYSPAVNIR